MAGTISLKDALREILSGDAEIDAKDAFEMVKSKYGKDTTQNTVNSYLSQLRRNGEQEDDKEETKAAKESAVSLKMVRTVKDLAKKHGGILAFEKMVQDVHALLEEAGSIDSVLEITEFLKEK